MDIPLDLKLFMNNAASKVYKCDQCNASYSDKAYFEMHKQSHQKEVLQIVMTSGAGSTSGHPAPAHQQQVIHLQDQNQQLRAFKQAYGSDAQVYQVVDGSYQVQRSTPSTSSTTHQTMNHQTQVNVPTYTAPTYIMTEVPVQHSRIQTQQPSHQVQHQQQQQQQHQVQVQQQHQVQQQVQIQQQVQVQPAQVQQHVQHAGPGNPRSLQSQDTKERPYKCDQCTASFIDPAELSEHKKKHSGDGPFTCEDCHFTFMYKSHFRSHKTRCSKKTRTSTRIINPKPVQRNFPTHQNNQQNQHATHQVQQSQQQVPQHTPSPKKQYTKRNSEFNPSAPTFKRTKKETIKADRPFECNECDASFQSLQDLQNHKTKHTGEGPFKCEECRFVFLYRKLYEAHRRRCEKKRKESNRNSRVGAASTHLGAHHSAEQHVQQQQVVVQQQQQQHVQQVAHQIQHVQQVAHQPQQIQRGGPTTVSTVAQVHNIPQHQSAVIDMRAVQSQLQHQQVQQVQHLQHPQLIEQVIHVTPSGTIAGGRQDFAAVDMDSMNQIMNLIKVKGHH